MFYFLCLINDFTIMNRYDSFLTWNESRMRRTGGKQKHKCLVDWNLSLHEARGPVHTRVNTHRIYIDPDYVEFTQDNIYSD